MRSIITMLGLMFLATGCSGSLRVHPVHVDEQVDHRNDHEHSDGDHHDDDHRR